MSELVIIATGEVVESMTVIEAERITARIAKPLPVPPGFHRGDSRLGVVA